MESLMFLAAFVLLIALQRLLELHLSRRHELVLKARGAYERGERHYPAIVGLHASLFLGGQALRYWAILSLGERWTTRVMVLPGVPLVASGPYKHVRHPNYLAVALEILAAPMVFGALFTALSFTLLNAGVMVVRLRSEEGALRGVEGPC